MGKWMDEQTYKGDSRVPFGLQPGTNKPVREI